MATLSPVKPIAIVCGSGIDLLPMLNRIHTVKPFRAYAHTDAPHVEGHPGEFVFGAIADIPIVLQCGRLHFYEGYTYQQVVRPVDILHEIGVQKILFTNAVGGLHPDMKPGDLCAVNEVHLWPCTRWPDSPQRIKPSLTLQNCQWQGRYAWVHGPTYETPAEINALQATDCQVVGMSAAPELHRCHTLGLKAATVSCITNNCNEAEILTHDHVIAQAQQVSKDLIQIAKTFLTT